VDAREVASSARGEADRVLAYAFFCMLLQPSTPANDKPSFLGHLWHKAGRLHGIGDNRGTSLCFSSVVFRVYRKKITYHKIGGMFFGKNKNQKCPAGQKNKKEPAETFLQIS